MEFPDNSIRWIAVGTLMGGEYGDAPFDPANPGLISFVQGDLVQREIHVIDRDRFAEEGRAFFMFPPEVTVAAATVRSVTSLLAAWRGEMQCRQRLASGAVCANSL